MLWVKQKIPLKEYTHHCPRPAFPFIILSWFGNTEIGRQKFTLQFENEPMLKRFASFQYAMGFESFPHSLSTLIDVCLFSNW